MVFVKAYDAPPVRRNEILRYAGCKAERDLPQGLLDECLRTAEAQLRFRVCYAVFDLEVRDGVCDFGAVTFASKDLARNLNGCEKAVLFAATVGVGIDRLIAKYGALSPAKAVLFDAIGTERIEALCDCFCADLERSAQTGLRPRFSPGYGDLDLSVQKELFSLLRCEKHIGLTLGDSLLMSPSKSVTAIAGMTGTPCKKTENKCETCGKTDCAFRGAL